MSTEQFMNPVGFRDLQIEIGDFGLRELAEIFFWLEPELFRNKFKKQQVIAELRRGLECRLAPSIVSRGVAEFFDVSAPRFAFRIYVGKNRLSFINLRRIATLCNHPINWGERSPFARNRLSHLAPSPSSKEQAVDRLRKSTCIGDSVFEVPSRFTHFNCLEMNFGPAFGESRDVKGTPFVRSLALAGLCAQAVCFMATALLHRYAKGVYGISEITHLSQVPKEGTLQEIELLGLTTVQMARYFEQVGLRAIDQNCAESKMWISDRKKDNGGVYATALKGYLRSGFPVICILDLGRMAGRTSGNLEEPDLVTPKSCIDHSNELGWPRPLPGKSKRSRRHAVLAMGYSDKGPRTEILFHDPSAVPFMKARVDEMRAASCYTEDAFLNRLTEYLYVSVTPDEVRMPLGASYSTSQDPEQLTSIFWLSYAAQWNDMYQGTKEWDESYDSGECFLLDGSSARSDEWHSMLNECLHDVTGFPHDQVGSLMGDRWCWLQCYASEQEVWIWDAECTPVSIQCADRERAIEKCLVAILKKVDDRWAVLHSVNPAIGSFEEKVVTMPAQEPNFAGLTPAFISSYRVNYAPNFPWPKGLACDLYTFMQDEATRWLPPVPRGSLKTIGRGIWTRTHGWIRNLLRRFPIKTVNWKPLFDSDEALAYRFPHIEVMTHLRLLEGDGAKRDQHIADTRESIRNYLGGDQAPEIASFASYFPEISCWLEDQRCAAIDAVSFLMRMAVALNPDRCASAGFVIELVGGSLMSGIWPARRLKQPGTSPRINHASLDYGPLETYAATIRHQDEGIERLLDSLRQLAPVAHETNVKLALEVEPGPLYVLGNQERLLKFCDLIQSCATLRQFVGVNLDIAHWGFLMRTSPDWVRSNSTIFNSIIHAHVSDHEQGAHFGDVTPGELHPLSTFAKWVELLKELNAQRVGEERLIPYTGLVSGELEACKYYSQVLKFKDFLNN